MRTGWAAVLVGVIAMLATTPRLLAPFSQFDGGIAPAAATFTLHGLLPYRDYWLLYGPVGGWLLALPTLVFGPSFALDQLTGLLVVGLGAGVAFVIARRWTDDFPAALVAIATVLPAATLIGIEFAAWQLAVPLALAGLYLLVFTERHAALAGVLIGFAFAVRLDVGGYALVAALLGRDRIRVLAGFGAVAGPLAVLALVTTPIADLWEQLIAYPLIDQRRWRSIPGIEVEFPGAASYIMGVPLVVIPRAIILAAILRLAMTRPVDRSLLVFTVFALLCQLQTLARSDVHHYAQASAPALLLLAAFLRPASFGRSLRLVLPVAAVVFVALIGMIAGLSPLGRDRDSDLQAAVTTVRAMTARDEPIYVGLRHHRFTFIDPIVAYHLADRAPGTSQNLFNPGINNTDATQARMVRELVASGTEVLLLDHDWADLKEDENDSRIPGSTVLDRFITAHFAAACQFGSFEVFVRHDPGDAPRTCPAALGPEAARAGLLASHP
jgi:hypothetical protein